ncbi:uncharacterized protein N7459_003295 [Penicillium hispanicum]|uniref:uncharacterized protein n=1 Tax=Penicillium hispanicum TaxID=1080232 RepID=UPI00253FC182|nr:uncharacterized protein N7459_003295 [Penicillium hispanicum]KAJ5587530.1 hypothetical protein N7459_003295 [Penicillium hispanicum]
MSKSNGRSSGCSTNTLGTANSSENGEAMPPPYKGPPRLGKALLTNALQKNLKVPVSPISQNIFPHRQGGTADLSASSSNENIMPISQSPPEAQEQVDSSAVDVAGPMGPSESELFGDFDTISEEDDGSKFRDAQARYHSLEDPSLEDTVQFEFEKIQELSRQKIRESRIIARTLKKNDEDNEDCGGQSSSREIGIDSSSTSDILEETLNEGLRSLEKDSAASIEHERSATKREAENAQAPKDKPQRGPKISARDHEKAKEIGLRRMIGVNRLTKKLYNKHMVDDGKQDVHHGKKHTLTEKEVQEICLGNSNIVASAQKNASTPELTYSTLKNRDKALAETVAHIPAKDRAEAMSDKRMITKAVKNFDHPPKFDGKGHWALKGFKANLYSYQACVAWMRERERSPKPPHGGLLCDVMGLGKTISALANILDGRRLGPMGPIGDLDIEKVAHNSFDRITTYSEVMSSYPTPKPPEDLESNEEITQWWSKFYDSQVGLLHQIFWHRIVLDEGHVIKNHQSRTSIAVRALTGHHKWILSGTPLHNCIEELWPYFSFLKENNSALFETFQRTYISTKHRNSRERLINKLRAVLYRRTHESKLFGHPIVKLPPIQEKIVYVEICAAERLIYDNIVQLFVENINALSTPKYKKQQKRCILTMTLMLRMFTSHTLTAQKIVQYVLDEAVMESLKAFEDDKDFNDHHLSHIIARLLRVAKEHGPLPTTPMQNTHGLTRKRPSGDVHQLARNYWILMETLQDREGAEDYSERLKCAWCENVPNRAFVTSCQHLYCEECFYTLPEGGDTVDKNTPVCCSCEVGIDEAAYYGPFDNIQKLQNDDTSSSSASSKYGNKRKKSTPGSSKKDKSKDLMKFKLPKRSKTFDIFHSPSVNASDDAGDPSSSEEDQEEDWVEVIGSNMPGTKLNKVRDLIKQWIEEDGSVKIVVFTEFLDSIRLLGWVCDQENWGHTELSGKMTMDSRTKSIEEFQKNPQIKVMISSLKAGGVGIDLSAANKCILLDLWWNKAIQDQAYCRIYRIGQTRDVECIMLIAKDTIDAHMLEIQENKEKAIQEVISVKALEDRDTIKQLLEYFGDVEVTGGAFKVNYSKGRCKRVKKSMGNCFLLGETKRGKEYTDKIVVDAKLRTKLGSAARQP